MAAHQQDIAVEFHPEDFLTLWEKHITGMYQSVETIMKTYD